MSGQYDDIINLPHHVSKTRPQMSMMDRAAQFSPFAALTGYDAAIKETGRLTDEKIELDEIKPSSRKYPYIDFRPKREIGNEVLTVSNISKTVDGVKVLDNISFTVGHDDKIAFVGPNTIATTTLFRILAGELEPDEGSFKWGVTTSQGYFPKDNTKEFDNDLVIADWLAQYSDDKDATYVRGFLGRMLFAG